MLKMMTVWHGARLNADQAFEKQFARKGGNDGRRLGQHFIARPILNGAFDGHQHLVCLVEPMRL